MSLIYGFLLVSGTRIEVLGYTKQNVCQIQSAWPSYAPLPLYGSEPPPFLPGSPFFLGWVLTSFVPPAHKQGGSSAFVWKKAVTKHQARLLEKTAFLVGDMT